MYSLSCLLFFSYVFGFVDSKSFSQCEGYSKGTYISGENGCGSYIFCNGNDSSEGNCPTGHRFNANDNTCEELENGFCEDDENIIPTTKAPKKKVICPPTSPTRGALYVASEDSCTDYYACYKGGATLMQCPENLHFSSTKQACLLPKLADCKVKSNSVLPSPSKKPLTVRPGHPIPTRKPSTKTPLLTKLPVVTTTESELEIFELPTPQSGSAEAEKPKRPAEPNKKTTKKSPVTPKKSKLKPTTIQTVEDFTTDNESSSEDIQTSSPTTDLTKRTTKSSALTNEREEIIRGRCSQQGGGYFEFPDNCHFYYRCINKKLYKEECPTGYGWDIKNKTCTATACKNRN